MKKTTLTLALGLLGVPLMMGSCSAGGTSDFHVYKESTSFTAVSEEKGSSNKVYLATVSLDNRSSGTITINSSDFKAVVDGKEYTCSYFVFERAYEGDSSGFQTYYVAKKGTTKEVVKSDTGDTVKQENVDIAFKLESSSYTTYDLLYKGTSLKAFGA